MPRPLQTDTANASIESPTPIGIALCFVIGYPVIKCLKYLSLAACQIIKGVEWKGTDHFIGAAVIVGICIYFIGVSFQHGYELQKEADEIL